MNREFVTEDAGVRLDVFLSHAMPEMTRSAVQQLLEDGRVTLRGKPVKKNRKTAPGEVYSVEIPEPRGISAVPEEIPLDVRYEDGDVIVVNKPRGMVVHPAPGHPDGTLVNALLHHCAGSLSGINGEIRPWIVHRIDKDTSGLLVAAKNDAAHRYLAARLKTHEIARVYEAVVTGRLREDAGTVDAPIGRDPKNRLRMAVRPEGRPAVTHWEVVARYPGYTHVRCRLETGRTHQIRVHMASLGHPILGDTVYGGKREKGLEGQCLHARVLEFPHPRTGETVRVEAPLPEYFTQVLARLGQPEG